MLRTRFLVAALKFSSLEDDIPSVSFQRFIIGGNLNSTFLFLFLFGVLWSAMSCVRANEAIVPGAYCTFYISTLSIWCESCILRWRLSSRRSHIMNYLIRNFTPTASLFKSNPFRAHSTFDGGKFSFNQRCVMRWLLAQIRRQGSRQYLRMCILCRWRDKTGHH